MQKLSEVRWSEIFEYMFSITDIPVYLETYSSHFHKNSKLFIFFRSEIEFFLPCCFPVELFSLSDGLSNNAFFPVED